MGHPPTQRGSPEPRGAVRRPPARSRGGAACGTGGGSDPGPRGGDTGRAEPDFGGPPATPSKTIVDNWTVPDCCATTCAWSVGGDPKMGENEYLNPQFFTDLLVGGLRGDRAGAELPPEGGGPQIPRVATVTTDVLLLRAKLDLLLAVSSGGHWLRNWQTLLAEQTQNKERLREQVAQLKAKFSSAEEVQDSSQAAPAKVSAATYDWALKSSGASIDMRRTSEAFSCTHWRCSVVEWFSQSTPDAVLEPDMSPGNCWPLPRHQGQVVIRLPARVHLTAVSVQHIYKDVSPSGTVVSAPRDVAVFGLDADGEEEALLLTFTYDVTKEAIQTFPLKTAPFPRAFSYVKFLVKSNWGNPEYTCVYRVQVHGLRAGAGTS
ncbi:SUN domain-containing protein 5-like [Athene noctua]|uniref:SUN domain-containing protein 5-like n=1 Tax=Athene noctua TaxID=126797 RepID=UPI003EBB1F14